jgi:alpha-beta hydrolase superfamily lysophospholipase
LRENHVAVATFDFRGHGRSEGEAVSVESFSNYLADVTAVHSFLQNRYGVPQKINLLGHSMGGLVALHWGLQHSDKILKLILSSPFLGLVVPEWFLVLNQFLRSFAPEFRYPNPVNPLFLTHDPGEVKKYREDKLIRRKISVRLLSEMIVYASKIEAMDLIQVPYPVHLLLAGNEKVVDRTKTELFYEKLHAPLKEKVVFDGFYHEIFNERGQDRVFDVLKKVL